MTGTEVKTIIEIAVVARVTESKSRHRADYDPRWRCNCRFKVSRFKVSSLSLIRTC